jgi:peptidoglycan/LPS O-acetylase OafA/YrhL
MSASGKQYYPWFDYLRFVLAVVVMLYHDDLFMTWEHAGDFPVQIFFALSGWLIGGILLKTTAPDLPRFFFNRAIRIWIPYYVSLALLLAVSLMRDPIDGQWWEFVIYKLSFVFNLFGLPQKDLNLTAMPLDGTGAFFWTLNAEEQFYLLAPLLLVLAVPKYGRSLRLWGAISMVAWLTNIYASIVFGVFAAILAQRQGDFHHVRSNRSLLIGLTGLGIVGMCANFHYFQAAPIAAIGIVLLLAVKGQSSNLGQFLGGISYPLYLNHWMSVFVANVLAGKLGLDREGTPRRILAAILGVAIASVMYWLVDRQIIRYRNQWFSQAKGKMAMITAYSMLAVGLAYGFFMMQR